jgi:hypothetical protein
MNNRIEEINYNPPQWIKLLIEILGISVVGAIGTLLIVSSTQLRTADSDGASLAPKALDLCNRESDGLLSGRLYGAIDLNIDWHGNEMNCEGMLRPDDTGIRLLFSSRVGREENLIFVIGIDGEIDQLGSRESDANITIIDEIDGRFFSTGGNDRCWTTIYKVQDIFGQPFPVYQIDGELYCAGSLPSVSGHGSVTLDDFRFSGRLAIDDS